MKTLASILTALAGVGCAQSGTESRQVPDFSFLEAGREVDAHDIVFSLPRVYDELSAKHLGASSR